MYRRIYLRSGRQKDPLDCFEKYLLDEGVLSPDWVPYLRNEFTKLIDAEIEKVFSEPDIIPHVQTEVQTACTGCIPCSQAILHQRVLAPTSVILMP
jgi:TPP-dependent pyruvate/acetoin dehydrogenase alpha subunit